MSYYLLCLNLTWKGCFGRVLDRTMVFAGELSLSIVLARSLPLIYSFYPLQLLCRLDSLLDGAEYLRYRPNPDHEKDAGADAGKASPAGSPHAHLGHEPRPQERRDDFRDGGAGKLGLPEIVDRKSTRLNSSH